MRHKDLLPLNGIIQQCEYCGKIDVYKNDNHDCDREYQEYKEANLEHYS